MSDLIETLRSTQAEHTRDLGKLEAIAANLADISEAAAARVTARIRQRVERRAGYLGNLVSQLRTQRAALARKGEDLAAVVDAERDNIDELRLLRRLDEITRDESDTGIAAAREAVAQAREQARSIEAGLRQIDAVLADYPEEPTP